MSDESVEPAAFDSTLRRMCAAMLVMQALIVALAVPVLINVADVDSTTALVLGLGIAVACTLTSGLLRHRWAYVIGHLLQIATLALGFFTPAMFGVGGLFALLWVSAYVLGRRIEDDKRRWASEGGERE